MSLPIVLFVAFVVALLSGGMAWVAAQWMVTGHERRVARESLARLRELASNVSANVDAHASRIEAVTDALKAPEGKREEAVLAAVAELLTANDQLQKQLNQADQRLNTQARQIESHALEARTDALTQVANRRALDDQIEAAIEALKTRNEPTTAMLIDVDHFKRFNDTHGHQAGDEVLRHVARVLRQNASQDHMVARYGGEEFAIVFSGLSMSNARHLAERARQAIAATPLRLDGKELRVTASGGVAELLPNETTANWLQRIDKALYTSKEAGRNCAHWHDGAETHLIRHESFSDRLASSAANDDVEEMLNQEWPDESLATPDSPYQDAIAHVSSRPMFVDDLMRRLNHVRRGGTTLTVILVQVDQFSDTVDSHGHEAAATMLRVTAQLLKATMRDMDHITRLGTNTFAMLLPGAKLSDGALVAERLRQAALRCVLPKRCGQSAMTFSIGVVEASSTDDLRRILSRARDALQVAMDRGRNRICAQELPAAQRVAVTVPAGNAGNTSGPVSPRPSKPR